MAETKKKVSELPKDVEIGFHQGSLNTLLNERNELVKLIQHIQRLMEAHIKRLEELGVKVQTKKAEEKKEN
jgi:hypothetical protein